MMTGNQWLVNFKQIRYPQHQGKNAMTKLVILKNLKFKIIKFKKHLKKNRNKILEKKKIKKK